MQLVDNNEWWGKFGNLVCDHEHEWLIRNVEQFGDGRTYICCLRCKVFCFIPKHISMIEKDA